MSERNLNQVPMSLGKNVFASMRFYFEKLDFTVTI